MVHAKNRVPSPAMRRSYPGDAPWTGSVVSTDGSTRSHPNRIRILRLAQVLDATGLGKTKIYELQSTGHFPMRVQLSRHSVGWIEAEVQAWLAERIAMSASPLGPRSSGRRRLEIAR